MAANKAVTAADASEQVKLVLRWIVKYRFWLILGLSALLPAVGYAIGSGPVQENTKKQVADIKGADSGLSGYMGSGIPNDQWKPIVDDKKAVVTEDVNKAWDKLYSVQAPLLKWPEIVESRFHEWGRKWPENVDLVPSRRRSTTTSMPMKRPSTRPTPRSTRGTSRRARGSSSSPTR